MYIDLPLHWWHCPSWLFEKMTKLAEKFLILFVKERGVEELIDNLSKPLWFQSLGCWLWFDRHSSGLTTVVGGVLSQALKNINYEIWIYVWWWKWKTAIKTPQHIENFAWKYNILQYKKYLNSSKLLAKVDNSLLQDWFDLYYHQIFFDSKGHYTIIQQWLNKEEKTARRYHRNRKIWNKTIKILEWKYPGLEKEEFNIITTKKLNKVLNLISVKSENIRKDIVEIINYIQKNYKMPDHHWIRTTDFDVDRLVRTLSNIRQNINNFKDLLWIKWIGPKAIFNIVQTSQLIYWNEADRSDPARFSFTHWWKDWTPYKPKPEEFDESIYNLKILIEKAKKQSTIKNIYFLDKNNKQPTLDLM